MKISFDRLIRSGYALAFILLLGSYLLFFISLGEGKSGRKLILNSNAIINKLEEGASYMKDAETGIRGYVLTNDTSFLAPLEESKVHLHQAFDTVRALIDNDGSHQKERLDRLENIRLLVSRKTNIIDSGIVTYNGNGHLFGDTLKSLMYKGKFVMDQFRSRIKEMQLAEVNLLHQHEQRLNTINNSTRVLSFISMGIVALLIAYSIITFNRENRAKKTADKSAASYSEQLEDRVKELNEKNNVLSQLRSMEKFAATGRMASTMAHEIKNPLNNISLAVEQLKDDEQIDEDKINLLNIVSRNANRINTIITSLLNSTKFLHLTFESLSINTLLDEALEMAKDRIALHHITIIKKYGQDLCKVSVDAEKVRIALLNIIINAIEAIDGDVQGVIEITTAVKDGKCMVTIKDNGKGIDDESLSRLFEPFMTSKPNGTGLGLTNAQNIILNHKGVINVESKHGEGSSFIISLPVS